MYVYTLHRLLPCTVPGTAWSSRSSLITGLPERQTPGFLRKMLGVEVKDGYLRRTGPRVGAQKTTDKDPNLV